MSPNTSQLDVQGRPRVSTAQRLPRMLDSISRDALGFATRTTVAGIAALFTAMWLQLDTPRWALWTVFIVSPPVRGNALRKTAARLVGTVIGCVAALAIVGLFPQDRWGFYFLFSAWLGACAYWATLQRGYVAYGASLAAFTSAIVAANVSAAPLGVWQNAMDRGSATILGILFALVASASFARTDNANGNLARSIRDVAIDLLEWSAEQLEPSAYDQPIDAPFTARILRLDETCINAIAERPALARVTHWFRGLPTALLALQSAVLRLRGRANTADCSPAILGSAAHMLRGAAASLRSNASKATVPANLRARSPALKEIAAAVLAIGVGLDAILTLKRPQASPPLHPPPKFVARPRDAATNLIRTLVAVALGLCIWNLTAWQYGTVFMANVAVAAVIFVKLENPVLGMSAATLGVAAGGMVGVAAKYLLLAGESNPLTLVAVLFPVLFMGAWIHTMGKGAPIEVFLVIGFLVLLEPRNPQDYDFVHDVNVLIAVVGAYGFTSLVFRVIRAPVKGRARVARLLTGMRRRRSCARGDSTRRQALEWETQMYDELQRLQAATKDFRHREYGVHLLLSGLRLMNKSSGAGVA